MSAVTAHLRRHARFYISMLLGVIVGGAAGSLDWPPRLTIAGDTFFLAYMISSIWAIQRLTPERLRRLASVEDEGMVVIFVIALGAICVSLGSIFMMVNQAEHLDTLDLCIAIASIPLGWLTLHTVLAFHYAHRFYGRREDGLDVGGLEFPGDEEPAGWDFVYYSFVVGMTAQVSDVQTQTLRMRRITLGHGVVSFFYNTVLVAFAVNIAASQAG